MVHNSLVKYTLNLWIFLSTVGLFVRPIRPEAWYASLLLTLVMVLMVLIPFLWNADYDSAESSMITQVRLEKNTVYIGFCDQPPS